MPKLIIYFVLSSNTQNVRSSPTLGLHPTKYLVVVLNQEHNQHCQNRVVSSRI